MCNYYNASARSVNTCGYANGCTSNGYTANGCVSTYNGCGNQFMCRDCNGNIWVRNTSCCGCATSYCGGCNHTYCGTNLLTDDTQTANTNQRNGNFTCVTFCGDTANTFATQASTTNGCGRCQRRCGGGCWNVNRCS